MSQQLRFNHVLLSLIVLSAMSPLLFPPAAGDAARGKFDNLFIPVAYVTRGIASALDSKFTSAPPPATDKNGHPKTPTEMEDEIVSLKYMLMNVTAELEELKKRSNEMAGLGPAAKFSVRFSVFGADAGTRQTLSLQGSSFDGLRSDMAVIYKLGIVGRLQIVGLGGARVLLVTDPQAHAVQCDFRRYVKDSGVPRLLNAPPFAVSAGEQPGTLKVKTFKWADVTASDLQIGDTVNLSDHDWPEVVQGLPLGEIVSIEKQRKNNLFADIVVKPKSDLMKLKEVMVVKR